MGCSRLLTWWSKNLIIELILFTSLLRECLPIQKWLVVQTVKNLPAMQETWFQSPGWEDPLQKGMATHSSILAWRITWTEEPGGLQSMGLQRVRHNWHNTFIICISSVQFSRSVMSDSLRGHLQGIFATQVLNPGLLYCRWILYHLSCQGSPVFTHREPTSPNNKIDEICQSRGCFSETLIVQCF